MLWLAVESATLVASVAVGEDERILAELTSHSALTHSERLLPMIDQALSLAGVVVPAVDSLVVSSGPGSFTGLRIGLATVKGLAQALRIPVVPVSTLEGLAWQQQSSDLLVPLLDARREQVYTASYLRRPERLEAVQPPRATALAEVLAQLGDQAVTFVGEGAAIYRSQIASQLPYARFADPLHNYPRASSLALLAVRDGRSAIDGALLYPDYLRDSQAEQRALGSTAARTERS